MTEDQRPTRMTEAQLQAAVIDIAHLFSWKVAHFRPALTKRGWRTPVAADGQGFPDLLLVRERVIAAELKAADGRLSAEQVAWQVAFRGAGCEAHTWRPADLAVTIVETLRRRAPTPPA